MSRVLNPEVASAWDTLTADTTVDALEALATKFAQMSGGKRWESPGTMALDLTPNTIQTPALEAIDRALVKCFQEPDSRLIITMPPQEGKSTRVANDFPIWALTQNPDLRIVLASYGQDLATRNGRAVRSRIRGNPQLGLALATDNGAASQWSIRGHGGGVKSVGIGGGITGFAADLMVIDDPVKSWAEAYSETYRRRVWDWWLTEASTRLSPGASVVLVLTRWHHDDLAGKLESESDSRWETLNIPAQSIDGAADPLFRAAGEYMVSARGRTPEQWELRKREVGAHAWASLFQGQPTPGEGNLLPMAQVSRYDLPLWLVDNQGRNVIPQLHGEEDSELIQSWDLAFKGTDRSDWVVGQVWLRRGVHAYLLDQERGRWTFTESCAAIKRLTRRWPQAAAKLVEDKANGPAVLDSLHNQISGLIPVQPMGSKPSRAHAIAPLIESGHVHLPSAKLCPWIDQFIEEATVFPVGVHDDQVDAMTQAINRLVLVRVVDQEIQDEYDLLGDDAELTWLHAVDY